MSDDKSFLDKLGELVDSERSKGSGGKRGNDEETTIILRGKDALRFLGIGDDEPPKGDGDEPPKGDEPPGDDEPPKRPRSYFKQ